MSSSLLPAPNIPQLQQNLANLRNAMMSGLRSATIDGEISVFRTYEEMERAEQLAVRLLLQAQGAIQPRFRTVRRLRFNSGFFPGPGCGGW